MTLPQFQQQARERLEKEFLIVSSPYTKSGTQLQCDPEFAKKFIDQLLFDFLLEIEKEVMPSRKAEIGGSDMQFTWIGWNKARQHTLDAFKRLRGNNTK